MHESTITRKLDALTSEVRETRRLVAEIHRMLADRKRRPDGVTRLDDGAMFVPGTGTIGERPLSPDAQAALEQLEASDQNRGEPHTVSD